MAKKVKRYKKYSLKTFIHKYENLHINTFIVGNGKKKIIVFLPIPHSGILISKLVNKELIDKVTLIAFDIPGWAGNQQYVGSNLVPVYQIVNITKSIVRYLKIKRYSVIGFQFGARIATTLASSEENIRSVVLINPVFKKSLVKRSHKVLSKLLRTSIISPILKAYYLSKYLLEKNNIEKELSSSEILNNYMGMLRKSNAKVISDSIYKYYNIDLSLHLTSLVQHNLLILISKDYEDQVEYLRRAVGRENVNSSLIKNETYPFSLNEKLEKEVFKFLIE